MKKLLILSGKGGTGKTTTAAAFIKFSNAKAMADCDVDAPNLHIVADVKGKAEDQDFFGSDKAFIDQSKCIRCGRCAMNCKFGAIKIKNGKLAVNDFACEGCGVCEIVCPKGAVSMKADISGELKLYKDEAVFSTAKLKMGRGNSGKLVTEVKNQMERNSDAPFAVIDGSPGIGCPVIASTTGVTMVLIVAEPSLSGISDLERILKTAEILDVPAAVCVNKFDTSPAKAEEIERLCRERDIPFVGKMPFDKKASEAVNEGMSVADIDCPLRDALWKTYQSTTEIMKTIS